MRNLRSITMGVFVTILLTFQALSPAYAQQANTSALGIATYLQVAGNNVKDAEIVSFSDNGYILSKTQYDALAVGVITNTPAVAIVNQNQPGKAYAVTSTGDTYVLVSGMNGAIKNGDLITTSTTPGIGMKATHSGYVIGTALGSFTPSTPKDTAEIPISLSIHYFANNVTIGTSILDLANITANAAFEEPTTVVRYIVAAMITLISFAFGFWFFGQTANRGLEAIGRNPLAARTIQLGIFLNVLITIAIIAGGLVLSVFVLRL